MGKKKDSSIVNKVKLKFNPSVNYSKKMDVNIKKTKQEVNKIEKEIIDLQSKVRLLL